MQPSEPIVLNGRQLKYFPLPSNKFTVNPLSFQTLVVSISRDAVNIGAALARLDDENNNHARHFVIDRTGEVYQTAPINRAIRHLPFELNRVYNHNSISVELINLGRVTEPSRGQKIITTFQHQSNYHRYRFDMLRMRVIWHNNRHYERFSIAQLNALDQLRDYLDDQQCIGINSWMRDYSLTPVFPYRKYDVVRYSY